MVTKYQITQMMNVQNATIPMDPRSHPHQCIPPDQYHIIATTSLRPTEPLFQGTLGYLLGVGPLVSTFRPDGRRTWGTR